MDIRTPPHIEHLSVALKFKIIVKSPVYIIYIVYRNGQLHKINFNGKRSSLLDAMMLISTKYKHKYQDNWKHRYSDKYKHKYSDKYKHTATYDETTCLTN